MVIWRVDVVFLERADWKYEKSTAGEGGGGRTHTFGIKQAAKKLRGKAVYARELTLEEATKLDNVRAAKTKKTKVSKGEKKAKRVSALDAAAQVLAKAEKPMGAQELIAAMAEQGLWSNPNGKTPHATLYAAMMRESRDKGTASRFLKVDRGLFATNKAGA